MQYTLWLVYEDRGILVGYQGLYRRASSDDGQMIVCPTFEGLTNITLYLQDSAVNTSILELDEWHVGEQTSVVNKHDEGKALNWTETTGQTLDQFYNTFQSSSTSQECFTSAIDLW